MISVGNIHNRNYRESQALQQLLLAVDEMLNEDLACDALEQPSNEQFSINIAGQSIAFYCGAVQADALCAFVLAVAKENLYEVNINANTVTE